MSSENERLTEAEIQIAKLKKLKTEKDDKEKQVREIIFMEPQPAPDEPAPAVKTAHKPGVKALRTARIEKINFDRLHTLVNLINKNSGKNRLNKDKVINLIIKRLLEIAEGRQDLTKEALEKLIAELVIK